MWNVCVRSLFSTVVLGRGCGYSMGVLGRGTGLIPRAVFLSAWPVSTRVQSVCWRNQMLPMQLEMSPSPHYYIHIHIAVLLLRIPDTTITTNSFDDSTMTLYKLHSNLLTWYRPTRNLTINKQFKIINLTTWRVKKSKERKLTHPWSSKPFV